MRLPIGKIPVLCRFAGYLRQTGGAMAVVFAMCMPMFIGAAGVAVDLALAYNLKTRLNNAVDKAALAAATVRGSDDDIRQAAQNFFEKNFPDHRIGDTLSVDVEVGYKQLSVAATGRVRTMFMAILGKEYVDVNAFAEVTKAFWNDIEISLVLDLSGSMAGARITALREAASDLVRMIVPDNPESQEKYAKIAIIPYSMGVNVGTYAAQVRGPISSGTCTTPGCQYYSFKNPSNQTKTHQISTCVSERTGTQAYTDAAPSTVYLGRNYPASNNPCLSSQITPLSDNKDFLLNRIGALAASGSTAGHVGIAWGWYLLAPNFSYLWPASSRPADYWTEDLYKIAIIMSDGEYNSPYCQGSSAVTRHLAADRSTIISTATRRMAAPTISPAACARR
jgi:Flp pilus assembly protein TadG